MYTRFLTYDLSNADSDDYTDLYNLIKQYKGVQITESTYKIKTSDDWATFKAKFMKVTHRGDNVKAIVLREDDKKNCWIDCFTIR